MGLSATPLLVLLTAAPSPQADADSARDLLLQVVEKQERNQELQRQYTYLETVTTEHLRKDGTVHKTDSKSYQVTPSPDGEYRRLVAENGHPLSPTKEAKEEKKFQKYLKKLEKLSPDEREKGVKKMAGRVSRFQTRLREALEVYEFTPLPDEDLSGQRVRCFHFSPRPGYKPRSRNTKILNRLEGTIWIDPIQSQIAKLHIIFREDMKFLAGLFGRISKGSEAFAEQHRVGDGLWLLSEIDVSLRARFYFFKKYRRRINMAYSDYKRFTVETEVGGFREVPGPN
jgi:hypothetical protein